MGRGTYRRTVRGAAITLCLAGAILTGTSCRDEEITGPTSSGTTGKAVLFSATSETVALSFRQISAGSFHTCAVTPDDQLYCWGDGSLRPVAFPGGLRFRSVSGGANSTCGLATDGSAYCWGMNFYGELGDGTTTSRSFPVRVAGGLRFRQVDMGEYHACGLTDPERKLYCWGDNRYGQLGDGTSIQRNSPVAVAGGRVFRQVSGGGQHTCAVTPTDRAYCWGDNARAQIGDGTIARRPRPTLVAGGRFFRQIDAGRIHTCGVTPGARAFCWGDNGWGELGNGTNTLGFTPQAVVGGISFTRVTSGVVYTCGETSGNRAYCWGDNSRGELGDGSTIGRRKPVAVVGGLTFSQLTAAVGGLHTCGKTVGGLAYCWGNNTSGGLGDGTTIQRLVPVAVVGPI